MPVLSPFIVALFIDRVESYVFVLLRLVESTCANTIQLLPIKSKERIVFFIIIQFFVSTNKDDSPNASIVPTHANSPAVDNNIFCSSDEADVPSIKKNGCDCQMKCNDGFVPIYVEAVACLSV